MDKDAKIIKEFYDIVYKKSLTVVLGTDPEIFVSSANGIIPAYTFLKGQSETKIICGQNPNTCSGGGTKIYSDGFAVEFTTIPQNCLSWLCDNIHLSLKKTLEVVEAIDKTAFFSSETLIRIDPKFLAEQKEEDIVLGCKPSLNAYGLQNKIVNSNKMLLRSTGGHIHFGISCTKKADTILKMVKALDAIIGVASVALFDGYEDPRRRLFYGQAGEYRTTSYGFEYRTLSNAWMFHPVLMNLIFSLARTVVKFAYSDDTNLSVWKSSEREVISILTNNDVRAARKVLLRNKAIFLELIKQHILLDKTNKKDAIFNCFYKGANSFIKDVSDITNNWNLKSSWRFHCDGINKNITQSMTSLINGSKI